MHLSRCVVHTFTNSHVSQIPKQDFGGHQNEKSSMTVLTLLPLTSKKTYHYNKNKLTNLTDPYLSEDPTREVWPWSLLNLNYIDRKNILIISISKGHAVSLVIKSTNLIMHQIFYATSGTHEERLVTVRTEKI